MATVQEKKNAPLPTRLRKLVAEGKWTQKEIADKVGVKPQSISQYLDGTVNPSYSVLIGMADIFCVSTDYLLGRTEIATGDINIASMAEETGLSPDAIVLLKENRKIRLMIARILDSVDADQLARTLGNYNSFSYAKRNSWDKMEASDNEEDTEFFRDQMLQMQDRENDFARQAFDLIKTIFMPTSNEMPYTGEIPIRKSLLEELIKFIPDDQFDGQLREIIAKIRKGDYDAKTL